MEEDRWEKLERIFRRIVKEELAAHGFKAKTKLGFEGGKWIGITDEQRGAWGLAYPACDIEGGLLKAGAWIVSNPTMAPKSQFGRFLNTWFSREQDRSSIRAIPTRNDPQLVPISKRPCAYCGDPNTGVVNNIPHCSKHSRNAMDHEPVKAA